MKRKICVVTGTRAEYGIMSLLMKLIESDSELELQIIATGAHLSEEYGNTYKIIEADGLHINKKVDIQLSSGTKLEVVKSMGIALAGIADALDELKPDIMVIVGDRYEIQAAAQAAMILNIPIAHIHGGELSEGAVDDAIRHSITKMSHIHFVSTETYKKRVMQLGENPKQVICTGAPGLDCVVELDLLSREELEQELSIKFNELVFLITHHPVTLSLDSLELEIQNLLQALEEFKDEATMIITMPNSDPMSNIIRNKIESWSTEKKNAYCFKSLGQVKYLSAVKHADVVIGNSSSGIIEVPFLKTPTVNIGIRQKGRISSDSIINVGTTRENIVDGIRIALSKEHKKITESSESLYGNGGSSKEIFNYLKTVNLSNILFKKFVDIEI